MWNAISSGLQAVQDRLDNVIDDSTTTQDTSQSKMTEDDTDSSEPLPSLAEGGGANNEAVKYLIPHHCYRCMP